MKSIKYVSVKNLYNDIKGAKLESSCRRIDLGGFFENISSEALVQLRDCLFLSSCPDEFHINFPAMLSDEVFSGLVNLFQTQFHKKRFSLRFNCISDKQLDILTQVLMTGQNTITGIELTSSMSVNGIHYTDLGLNYLANVLTSGVFVPEFYLVINENSQFTKNGWGYIAAALQSGLAPEKLKVFIKTYGTNNDAKDNEVAALFANALQSGKCPKDLLFSLDSMCTTADGLTDIAHALESGQCPEKLSLMLGISPSIKSGSQFIEYCAHHNTLPGEEYFSYEGIDALVKAVQSPNCPKDLTLDLSCVGFYTTTAYKHLIQCLTNGNSDRKLTLILGNICEKKMWNNSMVTELANILVSNHNLPNLSLKLWYVINDSTALMTLTCALKGHHFANGLRLEIHNPNCSLVSIRNFLHQLKNSSGLTCVFDQKDGNFLEEDIPFIEEQLKAAVYPQDFKGRLDKSPFSTELYLLCEAFKNDPSLTYKTAKTSFYNSNGLQLNTHVIDSLFSAYHRAVIKEWNGLKPKAPAFFTPAVPVIPISAEQQVGVTASVSG